MNKIISILCLGLFLLTGCGSSETEAPNDGLTPTQSGGKFYGGNFRCNELGDLRSLDPVRINDATSSHVAEQIYDRLLSFDSDLQLQPDLAERWEISEDGLTYTYYLRKGVMFHDNPCFPEGKGREMKAQDVVYGFTRICDSRTRSLGFDYFRGKVEGANEYYKATSEVEGDSEPAVSSVTGFTAINDYTFQIRLVQPFAPFENYVALSTCFIHPKEAVEFYGENFFKNPVGTGPFIFSDYKPDQQLVVTKNPVYWRKDANGNSLPYLDKITFNFIKDMKTQLLEFKQGTLEESYRIPSEFFSDIVDIATEQPKGEFANFQLLSVPALSTQYYGMMTKSDVFSNKLIRQAFSYAIDRQRIINFVLKGQANGPAHFGLVPPVMPNYPSNEITGYKYDVEKARALLAEAGYPNGENFPKVTLQVNAGGGRNIQVAEAIQGMLTEAIGVNVDLKQVEFARHLEEIDAGRASFYRLGWVADYPSPENFLNLLYGELVPETLDIASPINSVRYQNPVFDSLFQKALSTVDRTERMKLYAEAEQIAVADAPMMFIFHDQDYRFLQPYVEGYVNNAMDRRNYKFVWFNAGKMP